jgi:hypothetical protein
VLALEFDSVIRQLRKRWKARDPEAAVPTVEMNALGSEQRDDPEAAARLGEVAGQLARCVAPNRDLPLRHLTVKNHEVAALVRRGNGLHDTIPVDLGDDPSVEVTDHLSLGIDASKPQQKEP